MKKRIFISLLLFAGRVFVNVASAQVLETEESKPLSTGQIEVGAGLEFQTSSEGTETALPVAIEYGISEKLTVLLEPVPFTGIHPKAGRNITGIGDIELTLFYQIMAEQQWLPALSLSGEVKIPTAQNSLIGTGKTDITPYLIMSKTIGNFFTSVNFSYTFVGKPPGVQAQNIFNYAIGSIFKVLPSIIVFGEVYGNTSAVDEGEVPENGTNTNSTSVNIAELSGGETVISGGIGFYPSLRLLLSLGVSYDNNQAVLIRPGIEWKFGGK